MYASSINFFAASWLFLCLINSFCNGIEVSYLDSNHPIRPTQSDMTSIEEYQSNNAKSLYPDTYRDYQHNSMHPKISPKDIYSEFHSDQRYHERNHEEIMKKMNMLDKILSEDIEDENDVESKNTIEDDGIIAEASIPEEAKRVVRQVRRQRPGFFWTLARLAFETFNDTRSAIQQISNIINENFVPDTTTTRRPASNNPLKATDETPSSDQSNMSSNLEGVNVTATATTTTTTPQPFRFTRTGLQDVIRRNLRGLVRLFNIEWQDALNQSEVTVREFQKDLGNQVGGFLQDNPNAF